MAIPIRARVAGVCLALASLALTGCGAAQDAEVGDVADRFATAVDQRDGAAACALLAPSTRTELEQSAGRRCARALLEELTGTGGDRSAVDVYGTMARVRQGEDTLFLTRMQDGWHVLAAGCTPRPHAMYDCVVKGG